MLFLPFPYLIYRLISQECDEADDDTGECEDAVTTEWQSHEVDDRDGGTQDYP